MPEVADALAAVRAVDATLPVAMLHCTSAYPCPPAEANLAAIGRMSEQLDVPVGYSDHTMGVETPGLAVIAGARILEKHLTLDRTLAGPDHAASLEPDAFARCVAFVEQAWTLWGAAEKGPTVSEEENRIHSRRSLHTVNPLPEGETIGGDDVEVLRPATGIPPGRLEEVIGAVTACDVPAYTALQPSHIDGEIR
jgi:N-acetylneuraminate synthase/N,N'-diacetyllegionaminate synthase